MTPKSRTEATHHLETPERLPEDLDPDTLRQYFTLTESDLDQVQQCRGPVNRIGFSVQLCTLRWRGHFLRDTRDIPVAVLETIAGQLGCLPLPTAAYPQNEKTRFEHLERIRQHRRFVRCDDAQRSRLLEHLKTIASALPRSTALRQAACRWLQEQRIVRPGRTTLRDLMSTARETALEEVYRTLSTALAPGQDEQIDCLMVPEEDGEGVRSRLEQFKTVPRKESPEALATLIERLTDLRSSGLTAIPVLTEVHPATRRMLASWGYRYDVWSLRRFAAAKRNAIVLCFLQAARAEVTDAIIEMQDKLITGVHNKARQRYECLLRATEEARSRVVDVLEQVGTLVLDESIPDGQLRKQIFARLSSEDMTNLVEGCRSLQTNESSHLGLVNHWYGYTRKYSPELLEKTPFQFAEGSPLGRAVTYMKEINRDQGRTLGSDAPIDFLPRR